METSPQFPLRLDPETSKVVFSHIRPRRIHTARRRRDHKGEGKTYAVLHTDPETFSAARPGRGERHILLNPSHNRMHRGLLNALTDTVAPIPVILFPTESPSILNRLFTLRTTPTS